MSANTIAKRVGEFLQKFPPFDLGTAAELEEIASKIVIQYREANELIFAEGEKAGDFFYVVRQGSVKIFHSGATEVLVDICDEGDIFGVRPLLANEPYLASAQTQEECLLYAIPVEIGKHILQTNAKVSLFFAMGYASGKPMQRFHFSGNRSLANQQQVRSEGDLPLLSETILIDTKKAVLTCEASNSIKEAAQKMRDANVGSILVADEKSHPLGIVTDKDLRTKVATGDVPISEAVGVIMSSPVRCIKPGMSVAECMVEMVSHRVHHLCVTEDGSVHSKIIGIISDHDLLLEQGFNPAIIIKEMRKTKALPALLNLRTKADDLLKKYIAQNVSMHFINQMMAGINNALLHQIINLNLEKIGPAPCKFAWLALGSQGREEQLLRTDQDHALVFEDGSSEEENRERQSYFLNLANEVAQELERFGFEQDVADIGANHEKWCQPLCVWKNYFTEWIRKPDEDNVLLSTIFFDFRAAFGEQTLAQEMATHLYAELDKTQIFLPILAKNAMANPAPLSFFRNFVVESSGEHKDAFDLKLRAMLPLVDAARVLTLEAKISNINNTTARYNLLAEGDKNNRDLLREAAEGYATLMNLRAKFGLKHSNSGRFINPEELSKIERQTLRNIFASINDLQKILKIRFQLNYLR